jgi:hypothetical protein
MVAAVAYCGETAEERLWLWLEWLLLFSVVKEGIDDLLVGLDEVFPFAETSEQCKAGPRPPSASSRPRLRRA